MNDHCHGVHDSIDDKSNPPAGAHYFVVAKMKARTIVRVATSMPQFHFTSGAACLCLTSVCRSAVCG